TDLYFDELTTMILPSIADIDFKKFISIQYNGDNNYYTYYQYHSEVKRKLQKLFTRYENNLDSIFVVGNKNQIVFANFTDKASSHSMTYEDIVRENRKDYQISFFLANRILDGEKVIRIVGKINGLNVKSDLGFLVVDVKPDSLESLWGSSELKDGTVL